MAELLRILRERGSLSEAEYEALSDAADSPSLEAVAEQVDAQCERIDRAEIEEQKRSFLRVKEIADGTSSDLINKTLAGKWYERISIKGYTQFRIGEVLSQQGPDLEVPADRSVRDDELFTIRRGRLTFSGDVTERLFLYA